jgi:hypothetical protein
LRRYSTIKIDSDALRFSLRIRNHIQKRFCLLISDPSGIDWVLAWNKKIYTAAVPSFELAEILKTNQFKPIFSTLLIVLVFFFKAIVNLISNIDYSMFRIDFFKIPILLTNPAFFD